MKTTYFKFISLLTILSFVYISCKKEEVSISYSCLSGQCVQTDGGTFATYAACLSLCNSNNGNGNGNGNGSGSSNSYNCLNDACVDPGDGTGLYQSLSDCQNLCGTTNASYDCLNGACTDPGDGSGEYTNLSDCEKNCGTNNLCSNEFNIDSNSPQYEINGVSEAINYGNFYNSTTVNFEVRLFSSTIAGSVPNYNGIGNMIYLNLHTNGDIAGNYTFNANNFNPGVNTWDGGHLTNENMYNYSMGMVFPVSASSGVVEVINNGGNNYEINFDFINSSGNIIGCYSGQIQEFTAGGSGSGSGSGSWSITNTETKIINPNIW